MSCCKDRSGKGDGRRYGRGWSWVHSDGRNCRTTVLSPEGADTASLGSACHQRSRKVFRSRRSLSHDPQLSAGRQKRRDRQHAGEKRVMRLTFCAACGVTDHLQHHHLGTRSKGDSDDERNLITLCDPCHAKLRERRSDGPTATDRSQRGGRDRRGVPWAGFGRFGGMGGRSEEEAVPEGSGASRSAMRAWRASRDRGARPDMIRIAISQTAFDASAAFHGPNDIRPWFSLT